MTRIGVEELENLMVENSDLAAANRARCAVEHHERKAPLGQGIPTRCQSCGKQVIIDGGDLDEKCYFCRGPVKKEAPMVTEERTEMIAKGDTLPPVPARPDITGMKLHARMMATAAYYNANKEAILKEWEAAGKTDTLDRWKIGYASLRGLLRRWGVIPKPEPFRPDPSRPELAMARSPAAPRERAQSKADIPPANRPKPANGLPEFPAWETVAGESELIKLRWLDRYAEMARGDGK